MALQNNLKVFDENKSNVLSDADYESNQQRTGGAQADQVISSALYNTTLRSLSMICKTLIDALGANSSNPDQTFTTGMSIADCNTALDNLIKGLSVANATNAVNAINAVNATNADKATLLKNARSFSTANYDGTNQGAIVTFDGSGAVVLRLPSRIKAIEYYGTLVGNASTATNATNATTANKLANARNIQVASNDGTNAGVAVSFDGSGNIVLKLANVIKAALIGNATSATKLANARTFSIVDWTHSHGTGPVSFDGTSNVELQLPEELECDIIGHATTASLLTGNPTYTPTFTQFTDTLLDYVGTIDQGIYVVEIKYNDGSNKYDTLSTVLTISTGPSGVYSCKASAYNSINEKYVVEYIEIGGQGELQLSIDSTQGSSTPHKVSISANRVSVRLYKLHN